MCASVYFHDLTQEFVNHYAELMKEDPKKTEPMYDNNVKLVFEKELFQGHDAVCNKIQSLGQLGLMNVPKKTIIGQPYGENGDVLITANLKFSKQEYISTFVLHEIDPQKHRFAIIAQIMHPM